MLTNYSKFQSECPDIWIRLPKYRWPKSWSSMEDPVVPLERNLYGHPLAGYLTVDRSLHRQRGTSPATSHSKNKNKSCAHGMVGGVRARCAHALLFLSVYVDDMKLPGNKQNINPTWKNLMIDVDFGEPTSFLDHVYLGCTQREV